jgi:hypothetical protein
LRQALADASAGRAVTPLRFRSNDYWQEIAQDFNAVMQRSSIPMTDSASDR